MVDARPNINLGHGRPTLQYLSIVVLIQKLRYKINLVRFRGMQFNASLLVC